METVKKPIKVYVPVTADFNENGKIIPRRIVWEDGMSYPIDRVIDVRSSNAARAGGLGDRYTVRISGKETYLFFEHNTEYGVPNLGRWFVERRGE